MANILKRDLAADYRLLLSWRYNRVEFLGLPNLKENRPLTLDEIYVPLSFTWRPGAKEERFYLPKALTESRHLVALGDPGSGKSTLVKLITYLFGRSQSSSLQQRFGPLLPVPIILRDYNVRNWKSHEDMLRDFIGGLDEKIRDDVTVEWLMDHLRDGKAILLLDGIDEVGSRDDRKHLRDRVVGPLLSEAPECYSVLTSRIVGYEEVPFEGGADLKKYVRYDSFRMVRLPISRCHVAPFDDKNIEEFITRWYAAREEDVERRREGVESLRRALNQNDRVKRLAANPSLLTLMALIHRVTTELPSGRAKLYDKIVEAYLETIDRYRKLEQFPASLEQMKRWLARIGWEMQSRRYSGEKTELLVSKPDIFKWLKEAIAADSRPNPEEEAEQFLDWVERRSGLLVERGSRQYSFTHLTFQEYFAAFHLRGQVRRFDKLAETCAALAVSAHWRETLCVLFEMLAEFPGAGDDLLDELKSRAEKTEKNRVARRMTAELFSSLLPDEGNGLSDLKREEAAAFALELVTGDDNYEITENLKQLPPERFETLVVQWFDRRLKERRGDQFGRNFFFVGDRLITDWPERLGDWIERRGGEKPDEAQTTVITLIGAGDLRVCEWSISRLPIKTWLRSLTDYGLIVNSLNLADIYRNNLYRFSESRGVSPRMRLLAQASASSAIAKSGFIRATMLMLGLDSPLTRALARDLDYARARDRALVRDLARDLARDLDRALARDLARDLDRAIARVLDRAIARARAIALTRDFARDLALALSEESDAAIAPHQILRKAAQNNDYMTRIFRLSEQIFFVPESLIELVTEELWKLAGAKDDWTRLVAVSALLTLGEGTPELCDKRNALLGKGVSRSADFTFPGELHPETENEQFRKELPEILDLIFLDNPNDPWLKPELFDPSRPESKYFLSKPREFFILAADTLDPKGETELSQWRKRLAGE
ncbi:MAG: NACHT domain-containing protein [Blastocatellia bacterium]